MLGFLNKAKVRRFLTIVVVYCITFTTAAFTAGIITAMLWQDPDLLDRVLYYVAWTYGGELLMTAVIRLVGGKKDPDGSIGKTLSD